MQNRELREYQELISGFQKLETNQERKYIKLAQEGNVEARNKVICSNLSLVLRFSLAYKQELVDVMDLIQEGNIGLIKAISEFDCNMETEFSSYAIWKIKGCFTDYFRKQSIIVYPANIVDLARKINKLQESMTEDEIKKLYNIKDSQWSLYNQLKNSVLSLDDINEVPEVVNSIEQVDDEIYIKNLSQVVKEVLETLSLQEYNIVKTRYFAKEGLLPYRDMVNILKVSPMTCYNHVQKVKTKLKHNQKLKNVYLDI